MASTPTAAALLRQLNATLQLMVTMSSSLTVTELAQVRHTLMQASESMEGILEGRILDTGVSYAFNGNHETQRIASGSTSRGLGHSHRNPVGRTTQRRRIVGSRTIGRAAQNPAPIVVVDIEEEVPTERIIVDMDNVSSNEA